LNVTRQLVLNYHYLYDDRHSPKKGDRKRKAIRVQGSGWSTNDIFKDFYVINEATYSKAPEYVVLDPAEMSLKDLEQACFAFVKENQV
jgi:hypothetical protein